MCIRDSVELARRRPLADLLCLLQQAVRRVALRGENDDHVVAFVHPRFDDARPVSYTHLAHIAHKAACRVNKKRLPADIIDRGGLAADSDGCLLYTSRCV